MFDRAGKQVQLTDAGIIVYEQAGILSSPRFIGFLYDLMHLKRGTIKIGIPYYWYIVFPTIIKAFREQYPEIHIQLVEYGAKRMQKFVEQGEVDVGVVLLPVDENMFFTTPLARETLQLVVHKSHPLAQHSTISLKELKKDGNAYFLS